MNLEDKSITELKAMVFDIDQDMARLNHNRNVILQEIAKGEEEK